MHLNDRGSPPESELELRHSIIKCEYNAVIIAAVLTKGAAPSNLATFGSAHREFVNRKRPNKHTNVMRSIICFISYVSIVLAKERKG